MFKKNSLIIFLITGLLCSLVACGETTQVATPTPELEPIPKQQSGEIVEKESAAAEEDNDLTEGLNKSEEVTPDPPSSSRIIVIGEDFLLADVLAMGVVPIAATATLNDKFTGIERDTSAIQPLPSTEANFELLASLKPDSIITTENILNYVDKDLLDGIAPTSVISAESWRERVVNLGEILNAPSQARALLADYDSAISNAQVDLDGDISISLATIYPGATIAVWVDGPSNIPQTILDMGIELSPGINSYPNAEYGRAYISTETIGDLSSPIIILSQSTAVEGEDASLRNVQSNSLWKTLPAVSSGKVFTINRLGYPGVEGRIRLISDLIGAILE